MLDTDAESGDWLLDICGYPPGPDYPVRVETDPDLDVFSPDTVIVPVYEPFLGLAGERCQVSPFLVAHGLPGIQVFGRLIRHQVTVEEVGLIVFCRVEVLVWKVENMIHLSVSEDWTVAIDCPAVVISFPGVCCHEERLTISVRREVLPDHGSAHGRLESTVGIVRVVGGDSCDDDGDDCGCEDPEDGEGKPVSNRPGPFDTVIVVGGFDELGIPAVLGLCPGLDGYLPGVSPVPVAAGPSMIPAVIGRVDEPFSPGVLEAGDRMMYPISFEYPAAGCTVFFEYDLSEPGDSPDPVVGFWPASQLFPDEESDCSDEGDGFESDDELNIWHGRILIGIL